MKIGAFGDIAFEVSDRVIRTFKELQRSNQARWAVHEVLAGRPVAEFIGPGQKEITMPIRLNALFLGGKTIEEEIKAIERLVDEGSVSTLVIADAVVGKFYVESIDETDIAFGGKGEILSADIELTLKQYVERL